MGLSVDGGLSHRLVLLAFQGSRVNHTVASAPSTGAGHQQPRRQTGQVAWQDAISLRLERALQTGASASVRGPAAALPVWACAVLVALGGAAGAPAQACQLRAGFSELAPSVRTEAATGLPAGAALKAKANTQATLGLTCLATDSPWALDVSVSRRHLLTLQGAGAWSGREGLGELQLMPLTLTTQYRAEPVWGSWRPFAGLGLMYVHPVRAQASSVWASSWGVTAGQSLKLRAANTWAPLVQLGLSYDYNEQAFFELGLSQSRWSQTLESPSGQRLRLGLHASGFNTTAGWRF